MDKLAFTATDIEKAKQQFRDCFECADEEIINFFAENALALASVISEGCNDERWH